MKQSWYVTSKCTTTNPSGVFSHYSVEATENIPYDTSANAFFPIGFQFSQVRRALAPAPINTKSSLSSLCSASIFRSPNPNSAPSSVRFPIRGGFLLSKSMAALKPLTTEAIALTEKKMDMALDDIIKMSKGSPKGKKQRRDSNKSQTFPKSTAQDKTTKLRRFMDTRSSIRQGVLAQRRSNFQGNQFPVATEAARKAAVVPLRNRAFNRNRMPNWKPRTGAPIQRRAGNNAFNNKLPPQRQRQQQENGIAQQRPQTLDSLFANMKEQRMKTQPPQHNRGGHSRLPWGRGGRFGN